MIVCLCHRISDRDIVQAAKDGTPDFEALQDDTCLARNCGCCEETARAIFETACVTIRVQRTSAAPAHAATAA